MGWLYLLGLVILALVFLALQSLGAPDPNDGEEDPEPKPYQWGDELHEYSYRHPWDEEI